HLTSENRETLKRRLFNGKQMSYYRVYFDFEGKDPTATAEKALGADNGIKVFDIVRHHRDTDSDADLAAGWQDVNERSFVLQNMEGREDNTVYLGDAHAKYEDEAREIAKRIREGKVAPEDAEAVERFYVSTSRRLLAAIDLLKKGQATRIVVTGDMVD